MLTRPSIRLNSCRSCCSFTELAVGLTCWALQGTDTAMTSKNARAPRTKRMYFANDAMRSSPISTRSQPMPPSRPDRLAISGLPAPGPGAVAALGDPLLVDLGDDLAVAGEQRLGRTHLGA